ncbi:DUF4333 domain-containing protein [Micromonospora inaquosa]|uniref:DUF4333 domain-containing protein n=1 Tax=Micromonospora inaquosa TaxID=2203716 RepID=A0A3N9WS62_9ACTN|nr:DUF4333 domain-containing protein [Micromonospora inaquosa]RQX03664.1 hypothetical protein DLJ59_11785 [Micromonospora inaquosa]
MTNPYAGADGDFPTPAPRWAPAPPAQWGPDSTGPNTPVGRRRRVSRKAVIAVAGPVVAVATLVAVLGLLWPGFLNRKVFDTAALQQGVLSVLRDDYQLDADLVACPPGRAVTVGSRFSCSAQVAGVPRTITVTVVSSDGRFEVSRPH